MLGAFHLFALRVLLCFLRHKHVASDTLAQLVNMVLHSVGALWNMALPLTTCQGGGDALDHLI